MTLAIKDPKRPLSENEARELTAKIYGAIEVAWELIAEAYQRRADKAMGYGSWDEYCQAEFNGARLRLPREERQEKVRSLRESGLSTRAIASATGTSYDTVQRDLKAGDRNLSPESESSNVVGLDGKTYTQPEPEVIDAEIVEDPKTDPTPKRRPIADQARDAGWELRRSVERLERITQDDRFGRNKNEVAAHLRGHLLNAVEVCQDLLDRIE